MQISTGKFKSWWPNVWDRPGGYRVILQPTGMTQVREPNQPPKEVPQDMQAEVHVDAQDGLHVVGFMPPERAVPGFERKDYEAEALRLVQARLAEQTG